MDQAELDIVVGIFRMIPLSYNAVMKINDEITDCWSKRIFILLHITVPNR